MKFLLAGIYVVLDESREGITASNIKKLSL